jgi:hypothetical protein
MLQFVRRGLLVAALVVAGLVTVGVAPASATTPAPRPASATFVKCTDLSNGIYIKVGGALLAVRWVDYGYNGTAAGGVAEPSNPTPTTDGSCKKLATKTPATGTFVRAVVANAKAANGWSWSGSTYEIVGGTPVTVHSWANIGLTSGTVIPVIKDVLSSLSSPGACPATRAGCLYSRPANGTVFSGYGTAAKKPTTFYKVDSVGHPIPQAAATAGEKTVDQTSINACERMNCAPNGQIVNSVGTGYGTLHVDGWAMDFPSAAPVNVQLTAGGATYVVPANQPTTAVLPSVAGSHGFSVDLPIAAGSYVLCGTVLGTTPGATTQDLGCSNIGVPGAKPGKVHKPKVKARGHGKVRVKWRTPAQNGSPVNLYVVKVTVGSKHKKKQVAGSKHKIVLKHLPRGQQVRVKVKANNLYGFGPSSKKSKTVRVR